MAKKLRAEEGRETGGEGSQNVAPRFCFFFVSSSRFVLDFLLL